MKWISVAFFSLFVNLVLSCDDFDVRPVSYSTSEAVLSTETVFLIEGEAKCKGKGSTNLYAELNGILQPVSRHVETDNFQVSFVFNHKDVSKGNYVVRFYNEKGVTAYMRSSKGGFASDVPPVFTVTVKHKGISFKPVVYSETVALVTIMLIAFGAIITKNKSF
ncbi:Translocon-associated protein subunit delta [Schistosoma japonicum]|uniref:Translocon-associated protein subunit delta n=1 Tax=Schistosoma japonicum TaxID=6182 RepID=Q5DGE4_SCHJA|nr:SJCHGC06303 protein [Schistosoma japonicum]KAH8872731.1 Translocon-associated protein subunit delta [Schistosoma japonicum]CAX70264.1 signal sequence receptor, delta [Schistosoma japonicum]CAX74822.1 signal sequence receptor, delta [Schistosoma japonicum]CAX74823.1 signal sequence receptor, delta [Schistosoma japonicum]